MRKLYSILSVVVLIITSFAIVSCKSERQLKMVFLGDSIGEAIIGVSPISERDNYAYYSIVGLRNEYEFKNRSVSGHQTSHMLEYIKKDDDIKTTKTLISNADIIHVSILGNDFLQNDIMSIVISGAQQDYSSINSLLADATTNFSNIIKTLKSYNSDAIIMCQNVYNPAYPDCTIIDESARRNLTLLGIDKSEYRQLAGEILSMLNNIITDYMSANPNEIVLIDVRSEFDRVYNEDQAKGESLIFPDGVHPSNLGHALMSDLIQSKLEELGLANKDKATKNYKTLRIHQLERLYSKTLDINPIIADIKNSHSCSEITRIYFDATAGITPTNNA